MGEIIKVCCNACKKEWRCMEGSGLLYGKKESIIGAFSERERAKLLASEMEKTACPVCKSRTLTVKTVGHWD